MKVSNIIISNRTKQNAENLKKLFKDLTIVDWGVVPDFDMVINATSIGLNKNDVINLDLERARLDKEIAGLDDEIAKYDKKLSNKEFLEKAPAEVIEKQSERKNEVLERRAKLFEALERIS